VLLTDCSQHSRPEQFENTAAFCEKVGIKFCDDLRKIQQLENILPPSEASFTGRTLLSVDINRALIT
jgi:chromosome segregation and condensation protein ScpB